MSDAPVRKKRTRSSPKARPAYVIVQVLDESGVAMPFDKKRIKVVSVERNPENVMAIALNEEEHSNSIVLKVTVPASPNTRPTALAA
jgi:hypothetical protein